MKVHLAIALLLSSVFANASYISKDSTFIDPEQQEYDSIVAALYAPVVECSFDASLQSRLIKRKQSAALTSKVQINTIPTATIIKSKAVGEIPISSSVSPTGAKIYNVTIDIAQGMHGFQPNISLSYNSQSGNSVVGMGWNIGGLSAIVRGNKSFYYDDKIAAVEMNIQDAFFLDGVRLIKLSSSTDYIEYEAEQGNIKVRGFFSNKILKYFEVFYPNGNKAVFGYKSNTTNRLAYPLTSVNDLLGNTISFEYQYVDNQYNISKITYNGNSIEFSYTNTRADKQNLYCAGTKIIISQLLKSISVKNGSTLLRTYSLQYSTLQNKTVLTQIDLSANGKSLNPLQFKYGNGDNSNNSNNYDTEVTQLLEWYKSDDPNMIKVVRGKFDSFYDTEGLIVLPNKNPYVRETRSAKWNRHSRNRVNNLYTGDEKIFFYAGLNSDMATPFPNLTTGKGFVDILCADLDGDQEDRVVKINNFVEDGKEKLTFTVYRSNVMTGISLQYTRTFTLNTANKDNDGGWSVQPKHYYVGDFNGDGKQEIMAISLDHVFSDKSGESVLYIFDLLANKIAYQSNAAAIKYKVNLVGSGQSDPQDADNKSDKFFVADFNGDGKSDVCIINDVGTRVFTFNYNGNNISRTDISQSTSLNRVSTENRSVLLGDFNGDGLVDIMLSSSTKGDRLWTVYYSIGNGYFNKVSIDGCLNSDYKYFYFFAQDINNDGITDVISNSSNLFYVYLFQDGKMSSSGKIAFHDRSFSKLVPIEINAHSRNNRLLAVKDGRVVKYSFKTNVAKDLLLTQAINSLGVIDCTQYEPIIHNGGGIYTKNKSVKYPYVSLSEQIYVVSSESTYANGEHIDNKTYRYNNAVFHRQGLGFRGFERIIQTDVRHRDYTTTFDPYNYCVPISLTTPTTETQYAYSHNVQSNKIRKSLPTKVVEKNTLTGVSSTTIYSYDAYGFPLVVQQTFNDGFSIKKENTYKHDNKVGDKYILGYLERQKTTSTKNGNSLTEQYYTPVINTNIWQPIVAILIKGDKQSLQHTYGYDTHGNITQDIEYAYSGSSFTSKYEYDSKGRIVKSINPLGLTKLFSYDAQGNLASSTDIYGNKTTYIYDAFGREISRKTPDAVTCNTSYEWSDNVGLYEINVLQNNAPATSTYYDALKRIVRKSQKRINGNFCKTDFVYDSYGNLSKSSLPFQYSPSATAWNTYSYDSYNRIISQKQADGHVTSYKYSKNVITTEKDGIATSRTYDSQGNITKVSDPSGSIVYNLAPDGQPNTIVVNGNTSINYTYDIYRRTISIDDPSRGITQYVYTGANISEKIHANGETIYYTYDKYDRCSQMRTDDGFSATYTYNKYGDIAKVTGNNGTSSTYSYDIFGRLTEQKDIAPDNKWLQRTYTYNNGYVVSTKYTSHNGDIATEEYTYENGHFSATKVGNDIIYAIRAEDNMALPATIQIGSSYQTYSHASNGFITRIQTTQSGKTLQNISFKYDAQTQNLTSRTDNLNKKEETFDYDNLNRLTKFDANSVMYNTNGNILSKTDAGSYSYTNSINQYAVTKVSPSENSIPLRNQSVSYTSFLRPTTIEENGNKATFTYNANFERAKMNVSSPKKSYTRYYLGGCYELEKTSSGETERLYLGGNYYSANAVLCRDKSESKILYLLRDNLGSITKIIDAKGNTLQELSYDAWGRLRNPQTLKPYAPDEEPQLLIGRGYTGHEHLTAFGLINMNARLYDPVLGRFLSPDPYVQDITNLQNYNAYSYCLNNPLKYTDPTGESWKKFWKGLLGTLFIPILCPSTMLTLAIDFTRTTLFKGGLDITSSSSMHSAWRNFDPTKEGSYTNNAYKIDMGLYKTDSDLNSGKRFWQFVSRTSWECLQTYTGLFYSHGKNIAGCVNRVDYYGGATYCTNENSSSVKTERGVTIGNYINIDINDEINKPFYTYMTTAHNGIYMHEYGHTLQGRNYGVAYLFCIGVPSLRSAASHDDHKNQWYEREASAYARRYFGEEVWNDDIKRHHPSYGFLCFDD